LTKFYGDAVGSDIGGIISVATVSAAGGCDQFLVIVADNALSLIDGDGDLTTPEGELLTESGDVLLTEDSNSILADTGSVPACFLCSRGQDVYAIDSTTIVSMNLASGVIDTLAATEGTVPSGVTLGCVYRDRLALAGEDNAIYLSRQGDFTDWDYGADVEDSARAVAFQLGEAAELGALPTALIPFKDAALLAATRWGLWSIRGDPAADGAMQNVSRGVGIIGSSAWTLVQDGVVGDATVKYGVVFLAPDGLYLVSPVGEGLRRLSGDRLPEVRRDIAATITVSLVYSPEEQGVWIFLTPASGTATHWFFDLARLAFWPVFLQEDHQPVSVAWHSGQVILACQDGYLRAVGGDDDDGEDIESHVVLGPLRAAAAGTFGRVTTLRGRLAESSGAVTWRLVTGDTAEEACAKVKTAIEAFQEGTDYSTYVAASGELAAGFNTIAYPRIRAEWFAVWLQSTAKWAYETMLLETEQSGKVR
jgi:hypothetical protein